MGSVQPQKPTRKTLRLSNETQLVEAVRSGEKAPLIVQLQGCEQLKELQSKQVSSDRLGGWTFGDESVAAALLACSRHSTPADAVERLQAFIATKILLVDRMAFVYGAWVDRTYELAQGCWLKHVDDVPSAEGRVPAERGWTQDWPHETVLVQRSSEQMKLYDVGEKETKEDRWKIDQRTRRDLDTTLGLLSLVMHNGVFEGIFWDVVPDEELFARQSNTTFPRQQQLATRSLPVTSEHIDRFCALWARYDKVEPGFREPLRLALSRYRRALASRDMREAAIDVAVAFEALLVGEEKPEQIKQTLCLRAAWLLAPASPDQRLEVFKTTGKLYDYRSDLVHTGGMKWGDTGKKASFAEVVEKEALVQRAIALFEHLAEHLIVNGVPERDDWRSIILGIPDRPAEPPPNASPGDGLAGHAGEFEEGRINTAALNELGALINAELDNPTPRSQ